MKKIPKWACVPKWRKRIDYKKLDFFRIFLEEIQRTIEIKTRYRLKYKKYFSFAADFEDEDIEFVKALFKWAMPDIKKIDIVLSKTPTNFMAYVVHGYIEGERPHFQGMKKRIKTTGHYSRNKIKKAVTWEDAGLAEHSRKTMEKIYAETDIGDNTNIMKKSYFYEIMIGDRVWEFGLGWGTVYFINKNSPYPIRVCFDYEKLTHDFTRDGCSQGLTIQTLFWDKIIVIPPTQPARGK